MQWLRNILGKWLRPCEHKWLTIRESKLYVYSDPKEEPIGFLYVLKCEKCGDIKSIRI